MLSIFKGTALRPGKGRAALPLAVAVLLLVADAGAQGDNRSRDTRPYVEGAPSAQRYGDRRDARPGYRPGDRTPSRPGVSRGTARGQNGSAAPGTMPNCPPGSFNCQSGSNRR